MTLRRTTLLSAAVVVGLLAGPASAAVTGGGAPRVRLLPATEVGPRPVALLSSTSVAPAPGDPATGEALGRRVSDALSAAGVTTVAAAVDVEGYGPVLRRDAGHDLPPASTQKSWTGLAALVALGPDARFRTEVASTARPVSGRLRGSLWLVAGGDPYLTSGGLRALAHDVRAAGITTVAGDLRLDDSRYDARRSVSGWKSSYVPDESGPLSALAVDRNTWRTDAAFLADPALPAAVRFRDYLRAEGVRVAGTVRRERRPASARTLAATVSGPVPAVVRRALKASDNFAAEMLLKELGHVVRGAGTSVDGIAAVKQVVGRLGAVPGVGADGSGLSSQDRQNPAAQVVLLHAADGSGSGPAFRAALPIGCRDGTLVKRFCGTAADGRVMAKTGTLPGVRALAGYTTTADGRGVWFAFQLTGVTDGVRTLKAIDQAVVLLASATP